MRNQRPHAFARFSINEKDAPPSAGRRGLIPIGLLLFADIPRSRRGIARISTNCLIPPIKTQIARWVALDSQDAIPNETVDERENLGLGNLKDPFHFHRCDLHTFAGNRVAPDYLICPQTRPKPTVRVWDSWNGLEVGRTRIIYASLDQREIRSMPCPQTHFSVS